MTADEIKGAVNAHLGGIFLELLSLELELLIQIGTQYSTSFMTNLCSGFPTVPKHKE